LEEQTVSKPTFILMLQPLNDGVDEIKALRFVLKRLLRQYGLRCVTLREVHEAERTPASIFRRRCDVQVGRTKHD
jgi:hypothetical protein